MAVPPQKVFLRRDTLPPVAAAQGPQLLDEGTLQVGPEFVFGPGLVASAGGGLAVPGPEI